jgi:hypothetical protein
MKQRPTLLQVELLEDRTVPSGTSIAGPILQSIAHSSSVPALAPSAVVSASAGVEGPTVRATAGVPFSGVVGFYASPVLDPPFMYSATVNWGDGGNSKATLSYGAYDGQYGYLISATHTFAKPAIAAVKVTLVEGPINPSSAMPSRIVEYITDKAIVNSPTGVTINESIGKRFTADLGTFWTFVGPHLSAVITWGDGSSSRGTLTPIRSQGRDGVEYEVVGTHAYKNAGIYPVHIVVYNVWPLGGNSRVWRTIESSAVVRQENGTP